MDTTDLSEVTARRAQLGYLGWAVVGNGTENFVEPVAPRCPTGDPDLAALDKMLEYEHLACFGDRSITVEGTFGCPNCDGVFVGSYEPAWLASPLNFNFLSVDLKVQEGPFTLHFGPNGPAAPERGSIIRVTGHFDDAAAAECVIEAGVEEIRIDPVVERPPLPIAVRGRVVRGHRLRRGLPDELSRESSPPNQEPSRPRGGFLVCM